jgi:hypothetical protein
MEDVVRDIVTFLKSLCCANDDGLQFNAAGGPGALRYCTTGDFEGLKSHSSLVQPSQCQVASAGIQCRGA